MTSELTAEEERQVVSAIEAAFIYLRRLNLRPMMIPWDIDLETRTDDIKKVDAIIATIADKLRPSIDGFYEKALRKMTAMVESSGDEVQAILWYRMLCTFRYVVSIRKKLNGKTHPGYTDHAVARTELQRRGLWKSA